MRHLRCSLLVVVLGCTDRGDDAGASGSQITTVSQTIDRDRVLELTEELRVDGSRDDIAFFDIRDAALDGEGTMYVLDAGNSQIVVIDEVGGIVRTIGRQGQGPGEFTRPRSLSLHGDTLGVADVGNRVHLFRTDGSHIATRAHLDVTEDGDFTSLNFLEGTDRGWFLRGSAYFRAPPEGSGGHPNPVQRVRLFRVDDALELEPAGFYHEDRPRGEMVGVFFVRPPFSFSPIMRLDGLGRMHVIETGDYVIDVYDSAGELLYRVDNEIDRDPVTRADLDAWREDRACRPGDTECDESRTELALSMEIPDYEPVARRMVAFSEGHIVVLRSGTDPDPDDGLIMGEYDVFDPDGVFMGRLPVGLSPRWFDGELLLATEWNELMVPSMVRYRVSEP